MRQLSIGKSVRRSAFAIIHYCPKCKSASVMSLDKIRPAVFRGKDMLTYKCGKCGFMTTDAMR